MSEKISLSEKRFIGLIKEELLGDSKGNYVEMDFENTFIKSDAEKMSDEFVYHCGFNRYEADIAAGNVINFENNLDFPIV